MTSQTQTARDGIRRGLEAESKLYGQVEDIWLENIELKHQIEILKKQNEILRDRLRAKESTCESW